ncbi:MAG: hypothetical protein ACYCXW_17040 [Solirubrobacteraceae bacterium]
MKTTTESHASPAPGIIPEPPVVQEQQTAAARRSAARQAAGPADSCKPARRSSLARLLAVLRGDKYMVDAYPPAGASAREK